ncbi:MAG TPA: aminotransferase class IV [Alphaproteobacteria bacterium]|nr:aminotransferase class IV [Alphaproteobacteria bacterium]HOO51652.1 aminotransferase class IV [Alphaproteobacteria bacterium]
MIWFNGIYTENTECLSVFDKANIGLSVFTSILARQDQLVWGKEHIDRLYRHAEKMEIKVPYDKEEIASAAEILLENTKFEFSAIRIQVSAGVGGRGIDYPGHATVFITCTETGNPEMVQPVSVKIEKEYRRNETDPLSGVKSGAYGSSALCRRKAKREGYDDVILLNTKDHVACAVTANVFIEKDGVLLTPPLTDGVMDGIARSKLIKHHSVQELSLKEDDLLTADYIWLSNSFGLRGVNAIENQQKPIKSLKFDWV